MLFARILIPCLLATALLPAQSVDLLPDASLKGWTRISIPPTEGLKPKLQWRVDAAEKTLVCAGDGQHEWLRSDQVFGDYILDVDFRFAPKGPEVKYNSGIGLRLSPAGELKVLAQDPLRVTFASPTNIAFCGDDRRTLVVANLARWHLSKAAVPVAGQPLNYPKI